MDLSYALSVAIMAAFLVSLMVVLADWARGYRARLSALRAFPGRCRCHGRRYCVRCAWAIVGFTAGFPCEHLLWIYAPGFSWITHSLGIA